MDEQTIRIDDGGGVSPPGGYTGLWEVYWPNKNIKFRANYVDGETHGEVTCWWDNGNLAQTGQSDHGACRGIWSDYWVDGTKFKETEYQDNDNFIVRWYSPDGEIERVETWEHGEEVGGPSDTEYS